MFNVKRFCLLKAIKVTFKKYRYLCAFVMLLLFSNDTFSKSDFSTIFERHSAVMLIIEPKTGNILQANSAAQDFYGFAEKNLSH
jgi:hypothetical protein